MNYANWPKILHLITPSFFGIRVTKVVLSTPKFMNFLLHPNRTTINIGICTVQRHGKIHVDKDMLLAQELQDM